jgi:iron-sulfur cluster assembly protein
MAVSLNGTSESVELKCPIGLSEKAASEVKRIIAEQQDAGAATDKIYLRLRVVGGGCSGFQHKLDLDQVVDAKLDNVYEQHGVPVVIDRRSALYLDGVSVDYHEDLNRRGFSISNPSAKSTCGCGSSFSM